MGLKPLFRTVAALSAALCLLLGGVLPTEAVPPAVPGETVVRVTDFGADPYGARDSAPAVKAAVRHAKTLSGPVRIVFPRGTYQLYPDQAEQRELYVSNTVGADLAYRNKRIAILLEDARDVTVDGDGSRFVMHGQQTIFAALRSTNSTLRNFQLEWVSPRVVDLTVVGVGVGYRDIRIPDGYQYQVAGTTLRVSSENSPYTGKPYWSYASLAGLYTQSIDLDTGLSYRGGNPFSGVTAISEVSPGTLRFAYTGGTPGELGRVFQIRQTTRDTPGMLAFESSNTTIADIQLGYLHGFGIVSQLTDGLTVRNVDFRAAADSWRHSSAFADLIQVSGDKGQVLIEGNKFGFAHDDPVNVHGTYVQLVSGSGATGTFEYRHNETAGFPQFYPGDQVGLVDRSTMLEVPDWTATVVSVDGPSGYDQAHSLTRMTVTFDKPLPANVTGSGFVAENLTYSPDLTVRGNHFESIPTRGLLASTRGTVVIEDNVFDQQNMASVFVSGDANNWYESSAVRDMTIRRNVFIRPSSAYPVLLFEPITQTALSDRKVHSGIVIDSNTFMVGDTPVLDAKSVDGLTFTNNRVLRYDGGLRPSLTATDSDLVVGESTATTLAGDAALADPLVVLRNSLNITLGGNTYDDGLNRRVSLLDNTPASALTLGSDALTVNADNKARQGTVGYASSNPAVASVDAAGRVLARTPGTATITAWRHTPAGFADSAPLTVTVTAGSAGSGAWVLSPDIAVIRPQPDRSRITDAGALELLPSGSGLWATQNAAGNVHAVGTPTVAVGQSVTVTMAGRTKAFYEEAGLLLYTDDDNYVAIERKHNNGTPSLTVVTELSGSPDESRTIVAPSQDSLLLRLARTSATTIQASYSTDGSTFTALGTVVVNPGITDASRVAVLAGNTNLALAEMPRFTFSGLTVGTTAVPFAVRDGAAPGPASPPRPQATSRVAQLSGASFAGVELPGTTPAELATRSGFVARIPDAVASYSVGFTTLVPGATVAARLDGRDLPAVGGRFTVPVTGGANVLEVWVTAPDGISQRIYRWVTLSERERTPDPLPPVIVPVPDKTAAVGTPWSLRLAVTDRERSVTWAASGLPAGVTLDAATGLISGTPTRDEMATVRVTATDAEGYEGTLQFTLLVGDPARVSVSSAPDSLPLSGTGSISFRTLGIPDLTRLDVRVPDGWQVSPSSQWLTPGDGTATVTVRAPRTVTSGVITAILTTADGQSSRVTLSIALTDPSAIRVQAVAAWDSQELTGETLPNGLASAATDGDPATFWHTSWQNTGLAPTGSVPQPHSIVLDLGTARTITSLTYVPRSAAAPQNGQVKGYRVDVATAGGFVPPSEAQARQPGYAEPADATWQQVAAGEFPVTGTAPRTVDFAAPVTARHVRLTSLSEVAGRAWTHAAEITVAGPAAGEPQLLADVPLEARLRATPDPVAAGGELFLNGGGFAANAPVTLVAGSVTVDATTDAGGFLGTRLAVASGQAAGPLEVTATGAGGQSARTTVRVAASPVTTPPVTTPPATTPAVTDVYSTPGFHYQGGRHWYTWCEPYSRTVRCWTEIWSTLVVQVDGRFVPRTGWHFNTLTYLPRMTRAEWGTSHLANPGDHTIAGRRWRTECDTPTTGMNNCRSSLWTSYIASEKRADGSYRFFLTSGWLLNNIVRLAG